MESKTKLAKYLNGVGDSLKLLSKEVNKKGIDEESLDLMKEIGSALLFKGTAIDFTETKKIKNDLSDTRCQCYSIKTGRCRNKASFEVTVPGRGAVVCRKCDLEMKNMGGNNDYTSVKIKK